MIFADVEARLEKGLKAALPGPAVQALLSPAPRRDWPAGFNPARIRNAAGLILVYPKGQTTEIPEYAEKDVPLRSAHGSRLVQSHAAHIILTVRADGVRHGGQISLPGGVVDPGETFEQAALREAHEEVALPLDEVRVLGALTPLDIPVSGFRLHPMVAVRSAAPHLTPSDGEVARILEIDIDDLMNPDHLVTTTRSRQGITFSVPAFRVNEAEIWGATAMVLAEFLNLLGWHPPKR